MCLLALLAVPWTDAVDACARGMRHRGGSRGNELAVEATNCTRQEAPRATGGGPWLRDAEPVGSGPSAVVFFACSSLCLRRSVFFRTTASLRLRSLCAHAKDPTLAECRVSSNKHRLLFTHESVRAHEATDFVTRWRAAANTLLRFKPRRKLREANLGLPPA